MGYIDFTTTGDLNTAICICGKDVYPEHSPAQSQKIGRHFSFLYLRPQPSLVNLSCIELDKVVVPVILTLEVEVGEKIIIITITKLIIFFICLTQEKFEDIYNVPNTYMETISSHSFGIVRFLFSF